MNDLQSKEEALEVAKRFLTRLKRRGELCKKLEEDDMFGLECSETVEIESSTVMDASEGLRLAKWLLANP